MGLLSKVFGGGDNTDATEPKPFIALGEDGKPYVKDPEGLWKEVSDLRDDALENRKAHEKMWALCWAYYKGDQWRKPGAEQNLIRINVGRKPKITINRILPMVQTRRAHVLKNRPMGIVMPRTIDEEDRNASRIGQDILTYDQDHLGNWKLLDGKLSLTMFVTGNAFKKVYWDASLGTKKERNKYKNNPETGMPEAAMPVPEGVSEAAPTGAVPLDEVKEASEGADQEAPAAEMEEYAEGDVALEFVAPEEILPEPAATNLDDCQRLLHRTLKPLKWVKDNYPEAATRVQPINVKSDRGKALASGAKLFGMLESDVENRVEVIEAWFRPNETFPDGLHAVWADDQLMTAGPTPPAHDHIPFVHYVEIETDEFWGTSSVAQTIEPQKALNLAISRDEFMRQRLRPKLMAATDSGLDEAAYNNDDSEIVFVHHPFYPQFTKPPEFKRDAEAVAYFAQAIDDIGGSTDIMRGQLSGGDIRSGRMVNYLQEYAGTVLAGPARTIERGEEKTGNMILRLRKHYTSEPRLYYIAGKDRNVEVKQFIGSDIEGCADYVVQAGSALPMSASEKRDLVLSLVEKGVLIPGDPRILKLVGMPSDIEEMFQEEQLDRDNATEENHVFLALTPETVVEAYDAIYQAQQATIQQIQMSGMLQKAPPPGPAGGVAPPAEGPPESAPAPGQPSEGAPGSMAPPGQPGPMAPPADPMAELAQIKPTAVQILEFLKIQPRDFENHEIHLESHNRARKSKVYKKLPPAVQALFDEHCDLHATFLLPPPMAAPMPEAGGEGQGRASGGKDKKDSNGSPAALSGGQPPGNGGAGNVNAQSNQERSAGLPPTPSPPGANNHHLR